MPDLKILEVSGRTANGEVQVVAGRFNHWFALMGLTVVPKLPPVVEPAIGVTL